MYGQNFPCRGSDSEIAYASPVAPYWTDADDDDDLEDLEDVKREHQRPKPESIPYLESIQPKAYRIEAGYVGQDGRKRRYRGYSDDQGEPVDGFITEVQRVGGPYLCTIPVETIKHSESWEMRARSKQIIDEILFRHRIESVSPLEFVHRRSVFKPEKKPIFTCLIYCTGESSRWLAAVKEIYEFIKERGLEYDAVEIIHPDLESPRYTFPILEKDPIYSRWEDVRGEIVDKITLADVIVIGCYRRGRSQNVDETLPTILVIVDPNSGRKWKDTREEIVEILNEFHFPMIAVEIVKDKIRSEGSEIGGFDRVLLTGTAKGGQGVGPSINKDHSWTLGGFIKLQSPVKHDWVLFGLTCFHCVVPEVSIFGSADPLTPTIIPGPLSPTLISKVQSWGTQGVMLCDKTAERYLLVDQPTTCALRNQQEKLEEDLEIGISNIRKNYPLETIEGVASQVSKLDLSLPFRPEYLETEDFIEEIEKFADEEQLLGHVASGSGFGRIFKKQSEWGERPAEWLFHSEWALIQLSPGRQPTNAMGSAFLSQLPENKGKEDLVKEPVYIQGHGSDTRAQGLYSPLLDYVVDGRLVAGAFDVAREALSASIVGVGGKHFSGPGDSGSWVFTKDKYVVGMVRCRTFFNHITFLMEMDNIFKDIKESCACENVRVYDS